MNKQDLQKIKVDVAINKGVITEESIYDVLGSENYDVESVDFQSTDVFKDNELRSILPIDLDKHDYIDEKYLEETQNNYDNNSFVSSLKCFFDKEIIDEIIHRYRIGTSKIIKGYTIFWYLDIEGRVCGGTIMKFENLQQGPQITYRLHIPSSTNSNFKKDVTINESLTQKSLFFGEHLLKDNNKPVAIVENEETAIMANIQFPDYIWLATGRTQDLTNDLVKVLGGRDVTLCPRNDKFNIWYKKAIEYSFAISILSKFSNQFFNSREDLSTLILDSFD